MTLSERPAASHRPRNPDAPEVTVAPVLSASAGKPAAVPVRVVHRGRAPARIRVTIFGLDSRWAPPPLDLGVLQPGDSAAITLTILPERGALGASYPFTIAAESSSPAAPGGTSGRARPVVGVAEATLVLDAAERVSMSLVPSTTTAVFSRGIKVNITNPSGAERTFTLDPDAAAGARLRLKHKAVTIAPQQTVTVPGRVRVKKPTIFGGDNTHTFSIAAQGSGAPEWVEGTLRSTALVGKGIRTVIGLILVVALWATLAVVFIPKISDAFKSKNDAATSVSTTEGGSDGGASGGANGAADAGGASGAGGAAGGANGGAGGAGSDESGANGGQPAGGYVVSGTVTGPGAAGTSATLTPVSLASAGDDGSLPPVQPGPGLSPKAFRAGAPAFVTAGEGPLGKIPGPIAAAPRVGFRTTTVLTTDKGEFTIPGVTAPGYYLLTLAKAGFQTQRFLINSANLAAPQPMKVELVPGTGKLSGSVTGPGGAVGAATIVVTDGTVTLQTSSVSASTHTGTPGTWVLDQVSTPGTYLVTASAPGHGSASKLVTLDASGSAQVDLQLVAGQGSIVGTVSGEDSLGNVGGLGGITVTATGGDTTRTATTVTSAAMRGAFVLPNLPAPGDYTLTISGPGFLTQTREVSLGASGGSVTVNATLSRADAVVAGMVTGLDANGKAEGGLGGVGLTLASNDVTMKTMTTSGDSAGSYQFTGVAPGSYVLTAVQFGRVTASAAVELVASTSQTVNLVLQADIGAELPATAHIRGQVTDSRTSGPLTCDRALETVSASDCVATVTVTAPKDPADASKGTVTYTTTATAALNYVYTVPDLNDPNHAGLPPGLYTVTVKAPGYEDTVTHVQVAQGQTMPAPAASMPPLGIISGTVTTRVGSPAKASCVLAVPASVSLPKDLPTSCAVSTDGNTCTATGISGAQPCSLTSMGGKDQPPIGTYTIRGLTHGQYRMVLISQDPEYVYTVGTVPTITLELGTDGQFNAVLDRYGRIQVLVLRADQSTGVLTPTDGVAPAVSPAQKVAIPIVKTGEKPDESTAAAPGATLIKGLDGTYTVAVDAADGRDAEKNVIVGINQTITVTLVLTKPIGEVVGRVVANVDGTIVPVPGAKLTVGGVTGYAGQAPLPGTVQVTTDSNGCYALVPLAGATVPLTSTDCGTPITAGTAIGTADFVTQNITVSVDATGTHAESANAPTNYTVQPATDTAAGTIGLVTLEASPVPFGVHTFNGKRPNPLGGDTLAGLSMTTVPTSKPALAGGVTISSDASGLMTFHDSRLRDGIVTPGTYKFAATAPGYAPANGTLTCPNPVSLSGESCVMSPEPLVAKQLPQISGVITVPSAAPYTDATYITSHKPTVTLQSGPTGSSAATVALGAASGVGPFTLDVQFTDPQFGSISWAPGGLAAPGKYVFKVSLAGYSDQLITVMCGADYTASPPSGGTSSSNSNGCSLLAATMAPLPRFSGAVTDSASPANPLGGAIVAVSVPSIHVTVDGNGVMKWQDPNLPTGVVAPGTYTLTVSKPGYGSRGPITVAVDPGSLQCTIDGGAAAPDCALGSVQLAKNPVGAGAVHVDHLPPDPADPTKTVAIDWSQATVSFITRPGGSNQLTVTVEPDSTDVAGQTGKLVWADADQPDDIGPVTAPGDYNLRVTLPGYGQVDTGSFSCSAGGACAPATTVELVRRPAFSGTLSATPAPSDYSGATFTVTGEPAGTGQVTITSKPDGTLTWQEDGQPANLVRPGVPYKIRVSLSGYLDSGDKSFTCIASSTADGPICGPLTVGLTASTQLTIKLVTSASAPVNGAQIVFQGNTVILAETSNQYVYSQQLDPTKDYEATIQAAGYEFLTIDSSSPEVTCKPGETGFRLNAGGSTVCTVTLTKLGSIPIQTFSQIPSGATNQLGSVSITATKACASETGCPTGGYSFSSTSSSAGTVTLSGSNLVQGLTAGTWTITATAPGYEETTGTVTIDSSYAVGSPTKTSPTGALTLSGTTLQITLQPKPVTLEVHLKDGNADTLLPGTVTMEGDGSEHKCEITTSGGTPSSCVSGQHVVFTNVYPGILYTLKVDPTDTSRTKVQVIIQVRPNLGTGNGDVQKVDVSVSSLASTLSGMVTDGSTSPSTEIAGATVYLSAKSNSPTPVNGFNSGPLTMSADSDGKYSFSGVPNGDYYLVIEAVGYKRYVSAKKSFNASTNANVVMNVDLNAGCTGSCRAKATVDLQLVSAGGANLEGATTVTLKPETTPGNAPANTDVTGGAVTKNGGKFVSQVPGVPSGTWRVEVAGQSDAPFPSYSLAVITIADSDAGTTVSKSATLDQAATIVTVNWTENACAPAPNNGSSISLMVSKDGASAVNTPRSALVSTADGKAVTSAIYLPPGAYTWSLSTPESGFVQDAGTAGTTVVSGDASATGTVKLVPAAAPATVTVTFEGTPTAGLTVNAEDPDGNSVELTDEGDGTYTGCLAPSTEYAVTSSDYVDGGSNEWSGDGTLTMPESGPGSLDLELAAKTVTLKLHFEDTDGTPIAAEYTLNLGDEAERTGTADENGDAAIGGLTPGGAYTVDANFTDSDTDPDTVYSINDATATAPMSGTSATATTITLTSP